MVQILISIKSFAWYITRSCACISFLTKPIMRALVAFSLLWIQSIVFITLGSNRIDYNLKFTTVIYLHDEMRIKVYLLIKRIIERSDAAERHGIFPHRWRITLTHLPFDKMVAISQTIFSDAFSWGGTIYKYICIDMGKYSTLTTRSLMI